MIRIVAVTASASAVYGFALGWAHSAEIAMGNLVKLPLLILGTGTVCSLGYAVVGRFLIGDLGFAIVCASALRMFHDLSILLISLCPVTFFLGIVLRATDDGGLGEYPLFLGLNMLFIASCGTVAVVRQGRDLLARLHMSRPRATSVILCWLVLSLVVGGQGSFYLRPLVGIPASRGHDHPFLLGTTPTVRGARSFFEVVWFLFDAPPLPDAIREDR